MKHMEIIKKNIFNRTLVVIAFLGVFFLGIYVGQANTLEASKLESISNKEIPVSLSLKKTDFGTFWKVWNMLNEKSPQASSVTDQDRVYGAIKGLVGSFNDPYTVFFTPEESKSFNESINGSFGGVGMEVGMKDEILTVIAPMKDSPAYKAGIKAGDKILKIDETVTTDLSVDEAIKLIRGDIGTKVTITILRGEELAPREFTIVRQSIEIPTLDTEKRSDGIFVVRLYNFSANSSELFKKAMTEFKSSNYKKLILDLRGNPGGYLESAVDMASYFLKEGEVIVRESSNDKKDEEVFKSKGYNIFGDKSKFVILVDGGSASASEILAGALSEQGVATMIGEKTYGKGSVQELLPVKNDTSIKITVANWYTPNGVSISKNGLEPNIVSTFTDEDIKNKVDTQFERAVEFINKGK